MAGAPTELAKDIALTFVWDDTIESLYASWHRRVAAAEHGHRVMAGRLRRRHLIIGITVVVLATLLGTGAFASLRETDSRSITTPGVDPTVALILIGSISVLVAFLSAMQTFVRYSTRAEGHRIAALRYETLRREMATTLAIPREARDLPDRALHRVRQRMDRYAKESPTIGERLWGKLEATFDLTIVPPDPSPFAHPLVVPDASSDVGR